MGEAPIYVTPIEPSGIFVRTGPGTGYQPIESAFPGDQMATDEPASWALLKIGAEGTWLQVITASGRPGWVAAWLVKRVAAGPSGPPTDAAEETVGPLVPASLQGLTVRTFVQDGIPIYLGPAITYPVIGRARPDDVLVALVEPGTVSATLGHHGEWLPVQLPDETRGWAAAWQLARWKAPPRRIISPVGHALLGLHGPADPAKWPWDPAAYDLVKTARVQAVKLIAAGDVDGEIVNKLRALGVGFIMARLFAKFHIPRSPQSFVREVSDSAIRLYDAGVRYFEVHNEPNLHGENAPEGMWVAWQNGREFGEFLLECLQMLRSRLPDAKFGWPGLSPGPDVSDPQGRPLRYDAKRFLSEAEFAAQQCDFICMHTFWREEGFAHSLQDIRDYCNRFLDKLVMVTEFSNTSPSVGKDVKAYQYVSFHQEARKLPSNLGALFAFVLSALHGYDSETWRDSPIPGIVGARRV